MTHKRLGRKREFNETMLPAYTRLPESIHETLMREANQSGRSVHSIVRDAVTSYLNMLRRSRAA